MIGKFSRYVYTLVLVALWVALMVSPAAAEDRGTASTQDARDAERVTVVFGDSLWSISAEQLGPNATPQRIAAGVERIYGLNRDQIGRDPNMIRPGQELLLPSAGGQPVAERSPGRETGSLGSSDKPKNRVSEDTAGAAPRLVKQRSQRGTAVGAPGLATEQPVPPPVAEVAPVPEVRSSIPNTASSRIAVVASNISSMFSAASEHYPNDRQALGLAIVGLTWLVGLLIVLCKLLMGRRIARAERRHGLLTYAPVAASYADRALPAINPDRRERARRRFPTSPARGRGSGDPESRNPKAMNDLDPTKLVGVTLGKRGARRRQAGRVRTPKTRRLPQGGSAAGVHAPEVRRYLRRVPAADRREVSRSARLGQR